MQGRLENRHLEVDVATSCDHCGREIHIHLDSELHYRVREADARPLVFQPHVDWATYNRPTIIDGY